jgi:hypothetical protein
LDFGFFDPHSAIRIPQSLHGDAIVREFSLGFPCSGHITAISDELIIKDQARN